MCAGCVKSLPHISNSCPICALPGPNEPCGRCIQTRPSFVATIAALRYDWPVNALLHSFKGSADLRIGRALAQLLAEKISSAKRFILPETIVVPVPLHDSRLRERGFNQSERIARIVAQHTGATIDTSVLVRTQATNDQKTLSRQARQTNLIDAFSLQKAPPADILLVDDIITTGATAEAASRALMRAGSNRVAVCCIARTPL